MSWYTCEVNQAGPGVPGQGTTPTGVYIMLTDTAKPPAFTGQWFYAIDGIQDRMLAVALAAINGSNTVGVGAVPPNAGGTPYTEIANMYLQGNTSDAGLPVGSVVVWCGSTNAIPEGWLYCNGTVLEQSQYPDLYKAIGRSFSPPSNSGSYDANTEFCLPDFRGYFLRGVDDGAQRDPDVGSRTNMQDPSAQYSGVGSVQQDQFRQHTHGYQEFNQHPGGMADGQYWENCAANTDPAGGNETRPINAYVYYIILAEN